MRTTTLVLVPVSSTVCSRAMAQPVMTLVAPTPPGQSLEEPTEESGSPPRERNHGIRPRYGFSLGFMGGGGETTLRTGRFGPSEGVTPGFGGEL